MFLLRVDSVHAFVSSHWSVDLVSRYGAISSIGEPVAVY